MVTPGCLNTLSAQRGVSAGKTVQIRLSDSCAAAASSDLDTLLLLLQGPSHAGPMRAGALLAASLRSVVSTSR
jgi:hypothetical protein